MSWWTRKPQDPVDRQLHDIERQGGALARLAHVCAFLLIILFSAGSLIALSGDALIQVARTGFQPSTIPAIISVGVSTLLVMCMDAGMLYAASMLRILSARRAEPVEKRIHIAVMLIASVLESCTYVYMAYRYDAPTNGVGWALVGARALAAPAFSIYLSMARPLPVGSRDILYQVELASGKGLIRDAVQQANDVTASMARKMALYRASAVMTEADGARLDAMIATLQTQQLQIAPPADDENTRSGDSETLLHIVPAQARPRFTARELSSERKRLEEAARRDKAFRFLDAHPRATGNQLQRVVGGNRGKIGQLHREWREAQQEQQEEEAIDA